MPIALGPSGFHESYEAPLNPIPTTEGPVLGICCTRIDECHAAYDASGFTGFFGNRNYGFDQTYLEFLRRVKGVRRLMIWDTKLKNVDGIYEARDLSNIAESTTNAPGSISSDS